MPELLRCEGESVLRLNKSGRVLAARTLTREAGVNEKAA
jgi:hypothetical protein